MKKTILPLLPLLALAACGPNREAADATMLKACQKAVKVVIPEQDSIEVRKSFFTSEKSPDGTSLRTVSMHVYYTLNHGTIEEKDYTCSFEESTGVMGYRAKFYRMDLGNGMRYGNFDGEIEGGLDEMMRITQALEGVLP